MTEGSEEERGPGWGEGSGRDWTLGKTAMRHALERRALACPETGRAGSHKSMELPVSMIVSLSPAVGTTWKQKWMVKSPLAVSQPGRYSSRTISPTPFGTGSKQ